MLKEEDLLGKLTKIGISLAAERDINKLLNLILIESMEITNCDAGSIYIKEINNEKMPVIRFKDALNSSRTIEFNEFTLKLDKSSIAGYVALTGEILNLDDVLNIDEHFGLKYNDSFDKMINYKTVNMLVVPMINYENEVVGVLQLINKKKENIKKLEKVEDIPNLIKKFSLRDLEIIKSLTAQAGILIERTELYDEIQELLSSFIQAMVTTLDSRDTTTSGHSRRLAGYALGFIEAINKVDYGIFKDTFFTREEIKELYYSALLHDIGKIGVSELVLQKRTKISPETVELLEFKFSYIKDKLIAKDQKNSDEILFIEKFSNYIDIIKTINEKPFLTDSEEMLINELNRFKFNLDGKEIHLLRENEYKNLVIKHGNLTEEERIQINAHVQYSFNILNDIKWIKQLKNVPMIASSHHEKMDGTGHPRGLKGDEISIQARILAILDIFEALTARDRPYKPPMSVERAISILEKEVEANHLDKNLFEVFMKEKIFELYKGELDKIINF